MKPTLYLIRGIPGSGKSTFAKSLEESGMVSWIFEANRYFVDFATGEYKFDAAALPSAHKFCQEFTKLWLSKCESVAVSNTSTTEKEVETYRKIAEETGAYFVSIVMENRHGGKNVHNVPEEKIQQMKSRFSIKL